METVVYFIRHSEVAPKSNINMIKNSDNTQTKNEKAILSVSGERLAEELSKNSELQGIDAVYSSSYVRSLETAKYIALENNTIINVDERLNERKIGDFGTMSGKEFHRLQANDFDFKLSGGESINQTKKRMSDAVKNILMFETGNRVVVVSHSTAIMAMLSAWCCIGHNYDEDVILTYGDNTIIDGHFTAPMVFKVVFDGMQVLDVSYLELV